jgi:hypothetical protein
VPGEARGPRAPRSLAGEQTVTGRIAGTGETASQGAPEAFVPGAAP